MTLTTRSRIAIAVASALALGVTHYASVWTNGDPGLVPQLWNWSVIAAYVFAIVAVFLVDRWWALLPVLAPYAVGLYIELGTDYVSPWASEELHPSLSGGYIFFVSLGIALQAAVLSIGFLPRRVWDVGRRLRVSRRGRVPSPRG
jgi:hypothetical protein